MKRIFALIGATFAAISVVRWVKHRKEQAHTESPVEKAA